MDVPKAKILAVLEECKKERVLNAIDEALVDKLIDQALQKQYANADGAPVKNPYEKDPSLLVGIIPLYYLIEAKKVCFFDTECIYDYKQDYGKLLQELVLISEGVLDQLQVEVTGDRSTGEGPTITLNNTYTAQLEHLSDYADTTGLLALLNTIVTDKKDNRQFHPIDFTKDQCTSIMFLTQKQLERLKPLLEGLSQ